MKAAIVVAALATAAHADPLAPPYAHHSLSIFVASDLQTLPTVAGRIDVEGGARIHRGRLAIEARTGAGSSFTARAGGYLIGTRGGLSIGTPLSISERIVVTPMLAYDLFKTWQPTAGSPNPVIQLIGIEVPVTILLYPHVALEPFVEIGLSHVRGTNDFAFALGPRIDLVL